MRGRDAQPQRSSATPTGIIARAKARGKAPVTADRVSVPIPRSRDNTSAADRRQGADGIAEDMPHGQGQDLKTDWQHGYTIQPLWLRLRGIDAGVMGNRFNPSGFARGASDAGVNCERFFRG